jgi:uncharacterized membrane protein YfcA
MTATILYLALGLAAGVFSGLLGIGGGIIIVPALIFICGFSQHLAQGTTLALMVPPIGLFAAWTYYKHGHVDLPAAALICAGFVVGSLGGARFAEVLSGLLLRRVFGAFMMIMAARLIFGR